MNVIFSILGVAIVLAIVTLVIFVVLFIVSFAETMYYKYFKYDKMAKDLQKKRLEESEE